MKLVARYTKFTVKLLPEGAPVYTPENQNREALQRRLGSMIVNEIKDEIRCSSDD
jgi:hypothetical protein